MLRHSLVKKAFCASLLATQVFAIIPATNALAIDNANVNVSSNKGINNNEWKVFGFEDEEELQAKIIQSEDFVKNWANIAYELGFGWCKGTKYGTPTGGENIGEDFEFARTTESGKTIYTLNARYNKDDKYANEFRASERLKMKISNVRFVIDPSTIKFGEAKIVEEKPLIASSAYATNSGSTEDSVGMTFNYSSTVNTSKTDNVSFTEGIGVKTTFTAGIPCIFEGKVDTNFNVSSTQGWSSTNGNSQTTAVNTQYTAKVPANSKRLIELVSLQRKSEIPYSAKIYMEYDITFTGFLRWSGNAHKDHPDNRPTVSVTFGKGKNNMSASEQIIDMYKHKDINGYSDWDWNWMGKQRGEGYIKYLIDKACKTNYGGILTGVFTSVDGTHVDIKAHEQEELNSSNRRKRSVDSNIKIENFKTYDIPNVKVNSLTIDKDGMSQTLQP